MFELIVTLTLIIYGLLLYSYYSCFKRCEKTIEDVELNFRKEMLDLSAYFKEQADQRQKLIEAYDTYNKLNTNLKGKDGTNTNNKST